MSGVIIAAIESVRLPKHKIVVILRDAAKNMIKVSIGVFL
jgi:hypothetical protein